MVEAEAKRCQDDADGAKPDLANDDEAVYGSGAGDAGYYGQLCHHHYLLRSRVEKEELKKIKQQATQYKTYSAVQGVL